MQSFILPMCYGLIAWYTEGDHRQAILSTLIFFVAGLALLLTVNEGRGRHHAQLDE